MGVAVGVLALMAGFAPAVQAAAPSPQQVPAYFLDQTIDWQLCVKPGDLGGIELPAGDPYFDALKRIECGQLTVPLDWNHPAANADKTVTIAASRLRPATGTPKGVLFTNPGGPGGSGLTMPLAFATDKKLTDAMEIVGFDVRGTGSSSNVTCFGQDLPSSDAKPLDPRNRSSENVRKLLADAAKTARNCQKKSGALGRTVNTEQTVKDLDLLRYKLGYDKLNWLGYSAGTWLGAHYAAYFPQHTGQMVLDSNVDFTKSWQSAFALQPKAFERRFRADFTSWVAKYNKRYRLGSTAARVRRSYEAMRIKLMKHPLPLLEGGDLYGVDLDNLIIGSMYSKATFAQTARVMSVLRVYLNLKPGVRASASQDELSALVKELRKRIAPQRPVGDPQYYPDAEDATFYATTCNDTAYRGTAKDLVRTSGILAKKYPLVGPYTISDPCLFWKRPALSLKKPTGRGVPGALMVQSVHDPATAYEGALNAHEHYAGSRLLTVTGEGDHGIYAGGNTCVDRIVDGYLIDGKLPRKDLSCKGLPIPKPSDSASGSLNALSRLAELHARFAKVFTLS
jgi:pimeloyl-ACP methyl ester carboxylesterase